MALTPPRAAAVAGMLVASLTLSSCTMLFPFGRTQTGNADPEITVATVNPQTPTPPAPDPTTDEPTPDESTPDESEEPTPDETQEPTEEPTEDDGQDKTPGPTGGVKGTHGSPGYNNYGAVSIAADGGFGYTYDYSSKSKAIAAAQKNCKKASNDPATCTKVAWVRNGCLSVAIRWDGYNVTRYGWAFASSKSAAAARAKKECGKRCKQLGWVCTTR